MAFWINIKILGNHTVRFTAEGNPTGNYDTLEDAKDAAQNICEGDYALVQPSSGNPVRRYIPIGAIQSCDIHEG